MPGRGPICGSIARSAHFVPLMDDAENFATAAIVENAARAAADDKDSLGAKLASARHQQRAEHMIRAVRVPSIFGSEGCQKVISCQTMPARAARQNRGQS